MLGTSVAFRLATQILFASVIFAQSADPLIRIQTLLQQQEFVAARRELEQAFRADPGNAVLYNFLGVLEAQLGNYRQSEQAFRKATGIAPEMPQAYLNLGRLYRDNMGHDQEAGRKALKAYVDILRLDPSNAGARYELAALLQQQGAYQLSEQQLSRLSPQVRARPQTLALHCANEAALNHSDDAKETAKRLLDSPDLAEADVLAMLPTLQKTGGKQLAGDLIAGLQKRGLASPVSLRALGVLQEEQDRLADARATIEAAFEKGVPNADLLLDLARIAEKQKDLEGALGYLAHAREIDPSNATVHFIFGMVSVEMDLPIEAEKSLLRAVELDGGNAYYHYALAAVFAGSNKWGDALPHFQKYCELNASDPRGRLALASAYFHIDDIDTASKMLNELVSQPATAARAHYHLGLIWAQKAEYARAVGELNRATVLGEGDAEAFAELGSAQLNLEHYEEARQALTRSLALSSDGLRANMVLLSLYQRTRDRELKEQVKRVKELQSRRSETAKQLLRTIEARPR